MTETGLMTGEDGKVRCFWQQGLEDYARYHDEEWGRPVDDDRRLFEKICLEGFQSGLSWLTVLRKREAFRAAFCGFDFDKVAEFGDEDIERCVADKGIIRHRGKIASTINNARRAIEMRDEFGSLAHYFWRFEPQPDERPPVFDYATLRANPTTPASTRLSKDLKKRGWTFVGPTTVYAFMQAMGMVNDHIEGCHCRPRIDAQRLEFSRP
ncbi:DNA-3-methyladenine glycosylase I [Agrobacterium rubi]|uniref:DNA-3-methyladenine glycosylase I n=1 Tax=Agrobacterium rubi TaxID=28099 RepID=A0AAE7R897_9HYPH|nr:DNA-3-methyladenine glycosylase I [Agrobacterium rubi]NTE85477.1 DNA-3-methyladenine glycosylase I [Agrobacterium rubi]NTF01409.1 DNA-3-methyladenine glycosylase I [Agrobacterium rubi]NTF35652.1 DNA-3-methyladenine glycosylase I [Agrobacterium rubi]OCJ48430.1 3-methyladenine DNA glycosylase [Agrobacterium rubi]QTG00772.1 DNA-3-methyladenine glycosylase I [Agrobacterium rubi]